MKTKTSKHFPQEYVDYFQDSEYHEMLTRRATDPHLRLVLELIEDRLREMEHKVFKRNRPTADLPQKLLLLHFLGMLKPLQGETIEISAQKQAFLLSIILDADPENIRKTLPLLDFPDSKVQIEKNYQFLQNSFNAVGLSELAAEMENKLVAITTKKESIPRK
jgi:hypothetical protein